MVLPVHTHELQPALQFRSRKSVLKAPRGLIHHAKGVRQHHGMCMMSPPMLPDNGHTQCRICGTLSWPLNSLGNNSSLVHCCQFFRWTVWDLDLTQAGLRFLLPFELAHGSHLDIQKIVPDSPRTSLWIHLYSTTFHFCVCPHASKCLCVLTCMPGNIRG